MIALRIEGLALASWARLAAHVEEQIGECVPRRLFLSRPDFETLRDAECRRDPEAARRFFRRRVGPYVAPLLPRGEALYELRRETQGAKA